MKRNKIAGNLLYLILTVLILFFANRGNVKAQEAEAKDSVYTLKDVDRSSSMTSILGMSMVMVMQTQYPEVKKSERKKGTVTVNIVLNENGEIINPVVTESLGKEYDDEALRVTAILQTKKWDSCKKDGKPVKTQISLPFTFDYKKMKR